MAQTQALSGPNEAKNIKGEDAAEAPRNAQRHGDASRVTNWLRLEAVHFYSPLPLFPFQRLVDRGFKF
jgi:hypothetical protein